MSDSTEELMYFSPVLHRRVPLFITYFNLLCTGIGDLHQDSELFKDRLISYSSL